MIVKRIRGLLGNRFGLKHQKLWPAAAESVPSNEIWLLGRDIVDLSLTLNAYGLVIIFNLLFSNHATKNQKLDHVVTAGITCQGIFVIISLLVSLVNISACKMIKQ